MFAVFKRELRSYFLSPIGYVFIGTFLLITTLVFLFYVLFTEYATSNFGNVLTYLSTFLIFLIPILTMRAFTEEKKNRTDQLLFTLPVRISSIVVGKFFASVCLFIIALLFTSIYVFILSLFGDIAPLQLVSTYTGFLLLGTSYIAIGIFISALTENQVIAAILTIISLFLLLVADSLMKSLSGSAMSGILFIILLIVLLSLTIYYFMGNYIIALACFIICTIAVSITGYFFKEMFEGILGKVGTFISLIGRYDMFSNGIFDLSSIIYYISFISIFIYITIVKIEQERWG